MRPPAMEPVSSQSSTSGILVTMRCSGFNTHVHFFFPVAAILSRHLRFFVVAQLAAPSYVTARLQSFCERPRSNGFSRCGPFLELYSLGGGSFSSHIKRSLQIGASAPEESFHFVRPDLGDRGPSDPRIPRIASLRRRGTQPLAELFQTVGDRQMSNEFHALITKLTGYPHAKRPAVSHRKIIAIHPVGKKSLRVHGIGHVHAVPPATLD